MTGKYDTETTVFVFGIPFEFKNTEQTDVDNRLEKTNIDYISVLGFRLPLTVRRTKYYELESMSMNSDILSARNIARLQIEQMIKNDEKLIREASRQYNYSFDSDSFTVNCIVKGCYQIT